MAFAPRGESSGSFPLRRSGPRAEGDEVDFLPSNNSGLPLADLVARRQSPTTYYSITVIDSHGRLASRSALRFMGWTAAQMVDFAVGSGTVEVAIGESSGERITRQGHLRLSPSIRRSVGIADKDRLILAADKRTGILVVGTMEWLDRALGVSISSREDIKR